MFKQKQSDIALLLLFLFGLRTNSPPQFGQTLCLSSVHGAQNVHSYTQMYASESCSSD